MKILTSLPPGDWSMVVFRGDIVFACPQHPPRIWDVQRQVLLEFGADGVFAVNVVPAAEEEPDPQMPLVMPGPGTKQ